MNPVRLGSAVEFDNDVEVGPAEYDWMYVIARSTGEGVLSSASLGEVDFEFEDDR